jgi:general secretion pathway protein G
MRPAASGVTCGLLRSRLICISHRRNQPTRAHPSHGQPTLKRSVGLLPISSPPRHLSAAGYRRRRLSSPPQLEAPAPQRQHRPCCGMTLIELMVLLAVIAVLALIVIPRVLGAARRSNEAALRADLRNFRVAIERFQADCGGYPPRLDDIMAWKGENLSAAVDGTGHDLDLSSYRGPYLRTGDMLLPRDPMTNRRDWRYDATAGHVQSASTLTGINGTPYASW